MVVFGVLRSWLRQDKSMGKLKVNEKLSYPIEKYGFEEYWWKIW